MISLTNLKLHFDTEFLKLDLPPIKDFIHFDWRDYETLEYLKGMSGVYFFGNSFDDVLYIGETKNLKRRMKTHEILKKYSPYVSGYLEVKNPFERFILEKLYIFAYRPYLNKEVDKCIKELNEKNNLKSLRGVIGGMDYLELKHRGD
jgi:hypothetical protein